MTFVASPETFLSVPGEQFDPAAMTTHIERADAPRARFSLINDMFIERGTVDDWNLLHDLHYKAENLPIGPRFWRLDLHGRTIGVIVTGNPKGLLKERHMVFPKMKPGAHDTKVTNTRRYKLINQNFRVISRFVVDTMFRGIGAGYRMMNLVSRMEGKTYMEIQSSMSKFNYFGQKAGFDFVKPQNSTMFEPGMRFFRLHFDASPQDYEAIVAEIESKSPAQREKCMISVREFYYRHSTQEKTGGNRDRGWDRVQRMDPRTLIKSLQQLTLASPMYGIWKNPDVNREVPSRLPLTAFDWQKPKEPLNLEKVR